MLCEACNEVIEYPKLRSSQALGDWFDPETALLLASTHGSMVGAPGQDRCAKFKDILKAESVRRTNQNQAALLVTTGTQQEPRTRSSSYFQAAGQQAKFIVDAPQESIVSTASHAPLTWHAVSSSVTKEAEGQFRGASTSDHEVV